MITNISASSVASTTGIQPPDRGAMRNKMLQAVADKLGMSLSDLKDALKSGTTLNQLATSKGISHEDLISTIKGALGSNAAAGVSNAAAGAGAPDDAQLTKIAEGIAAGKGARGAHGAHHHHRADADGDGAKTTNDAALQNVATTLGMKPADLVTALTSGTSLDQLAQTQGVPLSQVLSAVSKGMLLNTTA